MILVIKKKIAEVIGLKKFEPFGLNPDAWGWKDKASINLTQLTSGNIEALRKLLGTKLETHGVKVLLGDIDTWRNATRGGSGEAKARSVKQFEGLVKEYISKAPGQRLYHRQEDGGWLAYYVDRIFYEEPRTHSNRKLPPYVEIVCLYEEFGGTGCDRFQFYEGGCRSLTVIEALAREELYIETEELRETYHSEIARFNEAVSQIGKQFFAFGSGTDDLDGNPSSDVHSWYRTKRSLSLGTAEQPSRVVIDVFEEEPKDDDDREKEPKVSQWFWKNYQSGADNDADNEEDDPELWPIEVPIHPFAAVFHLAKHLRLRVHINNLTEYVYTKNLADSLVISADLKQLVSMLIEHKDGGFKDIIKGKSGGAVVLLAGKPGVGKTLTAEVFAEAESRALYSIQCSQLGTNPETLEDELLKVFARAKRWNAVMLLDEADVYVHERGRDMVQNAIVGVFLRVLEYQESVLFLTTNRPDDVDDAIASRCIARLNYKIPSREEQKKIWKVLTEGAGMEITDDTIDKIIEKNPELSGRDVKNLLKLAKLVGGTEQVTVRRIEFVKQFQPTIGKGE